MPEGTAPFSDRAELIQAIYRHVEADLPDAFHEGAPAPGFAEFVRHVADEATGEADQMCDAATLAGHAARAWAAGAVRNADEDRVVFIQDGAGADWRDARLTLSVVTDDRPFLVDSISSALSAYGKSIGFFANGVVDVKRDQDGRRVADGGGRAVREAMIHIAMDPAADSAEAERLEAEIRTVLADVTQAVEDWEPMRARLAAAIAALERTRPRSADREELREAVAFLKWIWDNRFAFLGARRFVLAEADGAETFVQDPDYNLGILRDPSRRVVRAGDASDGAPSAAQRAFLDAPEPILITKANARSVVHRRAHMDYVGVKLYHPDGAPAGEERFAGLFTAEAYNKPATDIPWLARKIRNVIERAQFSPGGHNERALSNILETFPRDEMFQIDEDALFDMALGVLRLYKRPRTKLFLRRDRFDRFVSALVFVPRERFNSSIRETAGEILRSAFDGRISAFHPFFGDGPLARVHFIIGLSPNAPAGPPIGLLEAEIAKAAKTWEDGLRDALLERHRGATPPALRAAYADAFSAGYKDATDPEDAVVDIDAIEDLGEEATCRVRAYRRAEDGACDVRLKLYRREAPIALSGFLPILENMGLTVLQEQSSPVRRAGAAVPIWVHEFLAVSRSGAPIDLSAHAAAFEAGCVAVLNGLADNDGFNGLILGAGLDWRTAAMLRACAKHALQCGVSFSQAYMEQTLNAHPVLSRQLADLFAARFDPDADRNRSAALEAEIASTFYAGLDEVDSLDEDRILRRFAVTITAMARTNFYQQQEDGSPKPYQSYKIVSDAIDEMPEPKPYREIFVSSPQVDGVHLRFGPVARGGLRWSDRREDYRTEVLDLVKAQQVKNAVITPVGAKGGFLPKQTPKTGDRDAVAAAGREAYMTFIRGLLDVTDNLIEGVVARPERVVAHDGDDPYLVVAADKGTARFSDTANETEPDYGFWLGDAFASGGSAGYDHKEMGITARGAWEAVKRHFREIGVDIQSQPFRVVGVGDMSGDVFGNGMLLSRHIKLVAAFDHRDIFVDPDPDTETSWDERKRLFEAPRSSWQDYDRALISRGGGVFSRSSKSVPLSEEMKKLFGLAQSAAAPNEIIAAILKAKVDLLWLGGIGTYFKGPEEENWRVGDRANDAIRIDGDACGARIVGEGANLGFTQRARIAYARAGGRINTDAIDNSAGVDSSDHEVNIKILLKEAMAEGALEPAARNGLLEDMTEDVAALVLRHNYEQTRALSLAEDTAREDMDAYGRFMLALEREGRLNRDLERLPSTDRLAEMKAAGQALTRPEIAVLMAYAKNWLFDALAASDVPDDPHFDAQLAEYFPSALHGFTGAMQRHRLRREIIATRLANEIVNTCGPTFAFRLVEGAGATWAEAARAYEIARCVFALGAFETAVDALDNTAPFEAQLTLYQDAANLLRRQVYWLISTGALDRAAEAGGLAPIIERYRPGVAAMRAQIDLVASPLEAADMERRRTELAELGVPDAVALEAAALGPMTAALHIVDLALDREAAAPTTAQLYFRLGAELGLQQIRAAAADMALDEHFDRLAVRRLIEDFAAHQRDLTDAALERAGPGPEAPDEDWAQTAVRQWKEENTAALSRYETVVASLDVQAQLGLGKLSLINRQLRDLAAGGGAKPRAER